MLETKLVRLATCSMCFGSHDFIGSCQTTLKQLTSGEIRDFEVS